MTRKDFEAIAEVLRQHNLNGIGKQYIEDVIKDLTVVLAVTNKNFDRERFIAACGGIT